MGDVAMTVPVVKALTQQYPHCKVTIVSKSFFKPLFDDIPQVSFFAAQVDTKHKGVLGLYQLYRELKKERITHVADFHNVLRSKIIRTLFVFEGKPCVTPIIVWQMIVMLYIIHTKQMMEIIFH
jgi:ADP-heptose:LPS heptosyltransferase